MTQKRARPRSIIFVASYAAMLGLATGALAVVNGIEHSAPDRMAWGVGFACLLLALSLGLWIGNAVSYFVYLPMTVLFAVICALLAAVFAQDAATLWVEEPRSMQIFSAWEMIGLASIPLTLALASGTSGYFLLFEVEAKNWCRRRRMP